MTVPSVSMKSALGMAHLAPVNGGDLALGPDHVTLRHSAILLIALAAASHILQRERACQAVRSVWNSFTGSLASLQACSVLAVDMRERGPFARALGVVAGLARSVEV